MAQALLDLHANATDYVLVEEGEIPNTSWSGEAVDTRYVDSVMEGHMEALLSSIAATGRCPEVGCQYASQQGSHQTHHTKSNMILYVCSGGYFEQLPRYNHTAWLYPA